MPATSRDSGPRSLRGLPAIPALTALTLATAAVVVAGQSATAATPAARVAAPAAAGAATAGVVAAFPSPGTGNAGPKTAISFRNTTAAALGTVTVTGSKSGAHAGGFVAHSDGKGVSFVPQKAFAPGETVTVGSALTVTGATGTSFSFGVSTPLPFTGPLTLAAAAKNASTTVTTQSFKTQPSFHPVVATVAPGGRDIANSTFTSPFNATGGTATITNGAGKVVYYKAAPKGELISNFRVQTYRGQKVLTWSQGPLLNPGYGNGVDIIADTKYHVIAKIKAANGLGTDFHEFRITPQNTALITSYNPVQADLSSIKGSSKAFELEGAVQEIDIPTGQAIFEWHSGDHTALTDTYAATATTPQQLYDAFHLNSAELDGANRILISARGTHAAYSIDRTTGAVIWQYGGKRTTYPLSSALDIHSQHDAEALGNGLYSFFDNGIGIGGKPHPRSRGVVLKIDESAKKATVVKIFTPPTLRLAQSQGNFQQLRGNAGWLADWGSTGAYTVFDTAGKVVRDVTFPVGTISYRAFIDSWSATPDGKPLVALTRTTGGFTPSVSWNGATAVASWRLYSGSNPQALKAASVTKWSDFETSLGTVRSGYVAVQAVDSRGRTLGTSATVRVG